MSLKFRHANLQQFGGGLGQWVAIVVVGLMVLLSSYVVVQSFQEQKQITNVFEGWLSDLPGYEKGKQAYQHSNRPMIVYFYADWCPHCNRLKETVLSTPEFQNATKDYIRVRVTPDTGAAEKQLLLDYGADGFPSFFVIPPGKPANLPFEKAAIRIETYSPDRVHKNAAQFSADVQKAARETFAK